jgi:hypothetical protein
MDHKVAYGESCTDWNQCDQNEGRGYLQCCKSKQGWAQNKGTICEVSHLCKTNNAGGKLPTTKRVKVGGNIRIVYQGKRGGEYIKMNGGFVSLAQLKSKKSKKT